MDVDVAKLLAELRLGDALDNLTPLELSNQVLNQILCPISRAVELRDLTLEEVMGNLSKRAASFISLLAQKINANPGYYD